MCYSQLLLRQLSELVTSLPSPTTCQNGGLSVNTSFQCDPIQYPIIQCCFSFFAKCFLLCIIYLFAWFAVKCFVRRVPNKSRAILLPSPRSGLRTSGRSSYKSKVISVLLRARKDTHLGSCSDCPVYSVGCCCCREINSAHRAGRDPVSYSFGQKGGRKSMSSLDYIYPGKGLNGFFLETGNNLIQ